MALTAAPQSALRGGWEDEIVPSLRKRLENESRMLSQRMSAASSEDEMEGVMEHYTGRGSTSSYGVRTNGDSRPSAIPRPSLQSRSPHDLPEPQPSYKRPRTYSQPFSYDGPSSRAGSPAGSTTARPSDIKPTRIPIARERTRSPSIASHSYRPSTATTSHGNNYANGESAADLWVPAVNPPQPSPPDMDLPLRHKESEIMREQAPFSKYGLGHSRDTIDQTMPRESYESEERPFEHWYRGDTSRNGGVGELRVGRRQEMLDIANYGHALRERPSFTRNYMPAEARYANAERPGARKRADSLGARESFYLEEDTTRHRSVLDEAPLTDVDVDGSEESAGTLDDGHGSETEGERTQTYSYTNHKPSPAAVSSPSLLTTSTPPTAPSPQPTQPPLKKPAVATQPKAVALSTARNVSAPAASPSTPSTKPKKPVLQVQTSRIRAKSSGAASITTTPIRGTPRGKVQTPRKKVLSPKTPKPKDDKYRSVGVYPALEDTGDDSLADAIPTWTQPKMKGDWDNVVLPAVAKKKGLDEQYEQADGSPKPRTPKEVVEPAPGTFGFDYSKYKPPKGSNGEEIPMDEFGNQSAIEPTPDPAPTALPTPPQSPPPQSPPPQPQAASLPPPPAPNQPAVRRPMSPRSPSPLAFAAYGESFQPQPQPQPHPVIAAQQQRQQQDPQRPISPPEEEPSGGCCKCVIM